MERYIVLTQDEDERQDGSYSYGFIEAEDSNDAAKRGGKAGCSVLVISRQDLEDLTGLLANADAAPIEERDVCRKCGEPNDDGEGWDGLCGNCADRAERSRQ